MKLIRAKVPDNLSREVENLVKSGVFRNTSEVVSIALKKMLAEQSREYLRDLTANMGITEGEMLKEWKGIRR